jgi:hypothetical protein
MSDCGRTHPRSRLVIVIARAVVIAMVIAAVRSTFWLERRQTLHERRSEAAQHPFDHVIGPDAKRLTPDLGRHMSVAQMPREPYKLTRIRVSDVDDGFRRCPNDEPRPVIELNAVSIAHCDRRGQIEKDLVALIGDQAYAPTMPVLEIERDRADGKFLRPFAGTSMNDGPRRHSRHISTRNNVVPSEAHTPART